MSDLLAAICAAPDDDAPRLVYADHLLESDDEDAWTHAELIIAQCTVAREPRGTDAWKRARVLEKRLVERIRATRFPGRVSEWARGFPSFVAVKVDELRAREADFRRLPAPRTLWLTAEPAAPVTLGDIAWTRRILPGVTLITIVGADGGLSLDRARLPELDEHDPTIAWLDGGTFHPALAPAVTRLALTTQSIDRVDAYVPLVLPVLDELVVSAPDAGRVLALLRDRKLRRLRYRGEGEHAALATTLAHAGALATLESFDAQMELHPALIEGIVTSSLTELTLRYRARDAASLATLAAGVASRLRGLHLLCERFTDPLESIAPLVGPRFDALETLSLARYHLDAATTRLDVPRLSDIAFRACKVEPQAADFLRTRGLLDPTMKL